MQRTPVYFRPKKKVGSGDFFRNYQCPYYDRCLMEAAREDLYMDCTACLFKDNVVESYILGMNRLES